MVLESSINPPLAKKIPIKNTIHGIELIDDYNWLRNKEIQDTIDYLQAENAYTKNQTKHLTQLQDDIFGEMKSRIKETDSTVPAKFGEYYYYSRTKKDLQYPIYCRKPSLDGMEEIILDINELAIDHEFFKVSTQKVSPDGKLLAYTFDTTGYEEFTLMIKDLISGKILADKMENMSSELEWTSNNQMYYVVNEKTTHRPYKVFKHNIGENIDKEVFHEEDTERFVSLRKSQDLKFLFISSDSKSSSEVRFLSLDDNISDFTIFYERSEGHEYKIEHWEDFFLIISNIEDHQNFRLMKTKINDIDISNWVELIPYEPSVFIEYVIPFKTFLSVSIRQDGLPKFMIIFPTHLSDNHFIPLPDQIYDAYSYANLEYQTEKFRLFYSNLITPWTVYEYDTQKRELESLKTKEVKNFTKEDYSIERLFVPSHDGVQVPVTIARHKDTILPGALILNGYGSYGISEDVYFNPNVVSLMDRDIIYAIAHVRGGSEMGRDWYENGKQLKKKNSFLDFIAVAEHLVGKGYTQTNILAIRGGSAGGLLMGAVVNMRPDLFHFVIAEVPFVDVINTMLDESIPLTTSEFTEWGNPKIKEFFEYMYSYSPYDNIVSKEYPHILVTAGLNDPRVQFWEPAKWVAKLRVTKTDKNQLLLRTNMGAGHSGASGRYNYLKEVSFIYSMIIDKITKVR